MFPLLDIGCLEHHLVIGKREMTVEKGDAEPVEVPILR